MKISSKILLSYFLIIIIGGTAQYFGSKVFTLTSRTINDISEETIPMIMVVENLKSSGPRILASSNEYAMIASEMQLMKDKGLPTLSKESLAEEEEELLRHGRKGYENALKEIEDHLKHNLEQHSISNKQFKALKENGKIFRELYRRLLKLKKAGKVPNL